TRNLYSNPQKNKPRDLVPWFAVDLLHSSYDVPTPRFPFFQPVRKEDASANFFSIVSTCRELSAAICLASSRSFSARTNCSLKGSMDAVWDCNSASTPSNFT